MAAERWLHPLGLLSGPAAFRAIGEGQALPLQGGDLAFSLARLVEDGREIATLPVAALPEEWGDEIEAVTARPAPFAGIAASRPLVMGILNITPDSFSDGGRHFDASAAIAAGHAMLEAGADILDVGGESTRPGASPVPPEEEIARVIPVVRELAKAVPISIDTRHAATMQAALEAGAEIINDVTALRHDPAAVDFLARTQTPIILMHMPGTDPREMQAKADYADVVLEVARFLRDRVATLEALGIARARIAIDPGIGFGKSMAHNLALIEALPILAQIGYPIMLGASRKRFIGTLSGVEAAEDRLAGSLAVALAGVARGAAILRVHDVADTIQALAVWQACANGTTK